MKTIIDSSRSMKYGDEMIIFYVEVEYDDANVDLTNDTVEGMEVHIDGDVYSTFENGKVFTHDMTEEVLEAIENYIDEDDFIQDVLDYEYDKREPNIHYPDTYDQ
jgi:hypothetical protein